MSTVVLQLFVALGAIVGGAEIFVEQVLHVADSLALEPLLVSLVLAPFATELPEKANSFFWVRDGKDSLALGNITGAMVFQSTLPVAIGLSFTDLGSTSTRSWPAAWRSWAASSQSRPCKAAGDSADERSSFGCCCTQRSSPTSWRRHERTPAEVALCSRGASSVGRSQLARCPSR